MFHEQPDPRHQGTHGWWQGWQGGGYLDTGHVSFSCTLACCASEVALFVLSVLLLPTGSRRLSLELPKVHNVPAAKPSATQSSGVAQRVRMIPAQQRLLIHGQRVCHGSQPLCTRVQRVVVATTATFR